LRLGWGSTAAGLNVARSGSSDNTAKIWDGKSGELIVTLVRFQEDGAVIWPAGRYWMKGEYAGDFWWTIGLCRFEPGEPDPYVAHIRRV